MQIDRDILIILYFALVGSVISFGTIYLNGGYRKLAAFIITRRVHKARRNADPEIDAVELQDLASHRRLRHRLPYGLRPLSERLSLRSSLRSERSPYDEEDVEAHVYEYYLL
ncbi:hypothetical protein BDW74DRAFT_177790 [Aspergillus multicolor]|uniref:uncharacterized protein n=1 Tax=Aspergillus multicolor TaxID=41759 RepID=UPI003CCD6942